MYKKMPYWAQFNKLQKIITAVSGKKWYTYKLYFYVFQSSDKEYFLIENPLDSPYKSIINWR